MKHHVMLVALLAAGAASFAHATPAHSDAQQQAVRFWTSEYTGADLAADNYGCAAPEVPQQSWANQQIRAVSRDIAKWRSCHEQFMTKLRLSGHVEYRVPAEVQGVMSAAEREQAQARLDAAYAQVAVAAMDNAIRIDAQHRAWMDATVRYVVATNRGIDAGRRVAALEFRARQEWLHDAYNAYRYGSRASRPASR